MTVQSHNRFHSLRLRDQCTFIHFRENNIVFLQKTGLLKYLSPMTLHVFYLKSESTHFLFEIESEFNTYNCT